MSQRYHLSLPLCHCVLCNKATTRELHTWCNRIQIVCSWRFVCSWSFVCTHFILGPIVMHVCTIVERVPVKIFFRTCLWQGMLQDLINACHPGSKQNGMAMKKVHRNFPMNSNSGLLIGLVVTYVSVGIGITTHMSKCAKLSLPTQNIVCWLFLSCNSFRGSKQHTMHVNKHNDLPLPTQNFLSGRHVHSKSYGLKYSLKENNYSGNAQTSCSNKN